MRIVFWIGLPLRLAAGILLCSVMALFEGSCGMSFRTLVFEGLEAALDEWSEQ